MTPIPPQLMSSKINSMGVSLSLSGAGIMHLRGLAVGVEMRKLFLLCMRSKDFGILTVKAFLPSNSDFLILSQVNSILIIVFVLN